MSDDKETKDFNELYLKFRRDMRRELFLSTLKQQLEVEEVVDDERLSEWDISGDIDVDFEGRVEVNGVDCCFSDSICLEATDYDLNIDNLTVYTYYKEIVAWFKKGLDSIENAKLYSTAGMPPEELPSGAILYALCRQIAEDLDVAGHFMVAGACEAVYDGSSFLAPADEGGEE